MKQNDKYYVGHRGSRGVGVENTIEAFLEGIRRSYQALECDVRVSKDLQFIIFHDPDLKRLALRDEIVENMTLEELKHSFDSENRGTSFKRKNSYITRILRTLQKISSDSIN